MPKIAFLFPGQGSQSVGMAQDLCANFPAARTLFDRASSILDYDLADLCANGPEPRLNSTAVSQPAIFVASWAALERLRQQQPELVQHCAGAAGLSLGEYTALAFADCLTFDDAVRVIKVRAEAMQAAADRTPSGMASVIGLERDRIESLCAETRAHGRVWIANLLAPGNIVVSGDRSAVTAIGNAVEAAGGKIMPLAVAGAFHTEIMAPADQALEQALQSIDLRTPRVPVFSNVDAAAHNDPGDIRRTLVRQVLSPVLWEDCVRNMLADGFDSFYEIGPGRVLKGLMRRIDKKVTCENVAA